MEGMIGFFIAFCAFSWTILGGCIYYNFRELNLLKEDGPVVVVYFLTLWPFILIFRAIEKLVKYYKRYFK